MTDGMKDSGVTLIGSIPEYWKLQRFKYCGNVYYGFPFDSKYFTDDDQKMPLIRIRDITSGEISTYYSGSYPKKSVVHRGDILVGMDGDFNVCRWNNNDALLNQRCCRINDSDKVLSEFLYYCLPFELIELNNALWSTTVKHLLSTHIENLQVAYPPIDEQKKIISFLDKKCALIDSITNDIERQIEILKQYKQSLITETVTKGLDKNVKMKDSGVEWIGEIPEEWTLSKIKYEIMEISDVDHYMPNDSEFGYPYLMISDIKDIISQIDMNTCKKISKNDFCRLSQKSKAILGDVIFARYVTIGTVCYVDIITDFIVSYACVTIHPSKSMMGKYLYYYFKSKTFAESALKYININTQGNIGIESLNKIKLPLPPLSEQKSIAAFLDSRCSKIDAVITDKQTQLDTLKKHKQSLIYEYVTGKKRVTEAA